MPPVQSATTISLGALSLTPAVQGAVWSHGGEQMDVNLLYFDQGEGVSAHVNEGLDVWIVIIDGVGEATIDGIVHDLARGNCLYIPAGSERSIRSTGDPLLYASAHPKRSPLLPA